MPSTELCEHVAGCQQCRGALVVYTAELMDLPPNIPVVDCPQCQNDLAAFIDIQRQETLTAAAQEYPQVWWHLWTCPECAETHRLTTELLDHDVLAEPHLRPSPQLPTRRLPQLLLPRQSINLLLSARQVLSIPWGEEGSDVITLANKDVAGYQIIVSVQPQSSGNWDMVVQLIPPLTGSVVVTIGSTIMRTPISVTNPVCVLDLPASHVTTVDGPDIMIAIEAEQ